MFGHAFRDELNHGLEDLLAESKRFVRAPVSVGRRDSRSRQRLRKSACYAGLCQSEGSSVNSETSALNELSRCTDQELIAKSWPARGVAAHAGPTQ
jgi:hypothetical protein